MSECIFCQIIDNKLPSKIIYQDDKVIAFEDLHPRAPQHVLIIPRKHIASLNDMTPEDVPVMGHLLLVVKQLAAQLGIAESGYRLVSNCGKAANQTVLHIHFHLIGGRAMTWPPG